MVRRTIATVLLPAFFLTAPAQKPAPATDTLQQNFLNPPNAARPRVWWHWMNGNITEQGIDLDLEWMHRAGIGGFHTFDAALNTPTIVDHRLIYMTPEWKAAFHHALNKANDLGLEVTIASSPGWSETGGPWVPPAQGMKKIVWSETLIPGDKPFHAKLAPPPSNAGPFQAMSVPGPAFYEDVAVLAYPVAGAEPIPTVTTSDGPLSAAAQSQLLSSLLATTAVRLKPTSTTDAWVQFTYTTPQSVQSLAFDFANTPKLSSTSPADRTQLTLERSDDGITFTKTIDLPTPSLVQRTVTFPPLTARYFRFRIHSPADNHPAYAKSFDLTGLQLFTQARNPSFEFKAGFLVAPSYYALPTAPPTVPSIATASVIDLTSKMSPDGTLTWTPPSGNWRVLRLGYSLIGKTNHPAPPEATGLEVDQLNAKDVEAYLNHYLSTYADIVGKDQMGDKGIRYLLTDSTETGPENWTNDMEQQFRKLRGYDLRPWLPAVTGVILESPAATDKFLWDYRRTIAELTATSHYDTISRVLHEHHMGYYGEALESGRPELGDDLEMRRATDIPMGAMWVDPDDNPIAKYDPDLRGAASIAHIYGQNIVGAESLTARYRAWGYAPADLKPAADMEMLDGVNRFMIHEVAHQPVTDKLPGLSLGPYGEWFGRNETWAEQARPWIDYLARCSYLLQQGRFHADLAYFYGEEAPLNMQYFQEKNLPTNSGYDFVNSDILEHQLTVDANGNLIAPSGATYRVLYLGGSSQHMTVRTLHRILDLVLQGATIAGLQPIDSPSNADDPKEFHKLIEDIWGNIPLLKHDVGKGHVIPARSGTDALYAAHVFPDWSMSSTTPDPLISLLHRDLPDGDLYFVVNRHKLPVSADITFSVAGKTPELWLPDTGEIRPTSYTIADGRTTIPLTLDPSGSVFVVFRNPAAAQQLTIKPLPETTLATISGPWQVDFEPNRGAPTHAIFDTLTPWNTNNDTGIRYFSGHATYTKTITLPALPKSSIFLDLGDVENLAEVSVNSTSAGIVWKTPFRLNITNLLKPGQNTFKIQITNLWVNRLIGDQQPNAKTFTFTTFRPYQANSPLLPSGLLGPVRLVIEAPDSTKSAK